MQQLNSILLICDEKAEDRAVLCRAVSLAEKSGARLTVAGIIDGLPERVRALVPDMQPLDLTAFLVASRQDRLKRFIWPAQRAGIESEAKLLAGTFVEEIVKEVRREGHNLVIVSSDAVEESEDVNLGGTCARLARQCPCPVLTARPAFPDRRSRVLVFPDLGPGDDEERDAINDKAMDWAVAMARSENGELLIAQTWTVPRERALRDSGGVDSREVDRLSAGVKRVHRMRLRELLDRRPIEGVAYQTHLLKGKARILIPRLAREHQVALVVVAVAGSSGLFDWLAGGVLEGVIRRGDCSVLTVGPCGLVTPGAAADLAVRQPSAV